MGISEYTTLWEDWARPCRAQLAGELGSGTTPPRPGSSSRSTQDLVQAHMTKPGPAMRGQHCMVADDHSTAVVRVGKKGKHSHWNLRPYLKEGVTPCPWATAGTATLAHSCTGIVLLPVHLWFCKKKLKFSLLNLECFQCLFLIQ